MYNILYSTTAVQAANSYSIVCSHQQFANVLPYCMYIEHIYMSEKKSNHAKEKDTFKKCAKCWQGGNAAKGCWQNPPKSKQFSRVTASMDSYGILKIPAHPPGGLEQNKLIYCILGFIKLSMVHMQRNYKPVQKVPGNELLE